MTLPSEPIQSPGMASTTQDLPADYGTGPSGAVLYTDGTATGTAPVGPEPRPGVHQARAVPKESAWNNPTRLNSVEAGIVSKAMVNSGFRPVLYRVNLGTKFAAAANEQLNNLEYDIRNMPGATKDELAPIIEAAMADIANSYNPGYALKAGEKNPIVDSWNAQLSEVKSRMLNSAPEALPGIIQGYRRAVNTTMYSYLTDALRQVGHVRKLTRNYGVDPEKAITSGQIQDWKDQRETAWRVSGSHTPLAPVEGSSTEKLPTAREIGLPAGWGEPEYRMVNGVRTLVTKDPTGVYRKLEKGGQ